MLACMSWFNIISCHINVPGSIVFFDFFDFAKVGPMCCCSFFLDKSCDSILGYQSQVKTRFRELNFARLTFGT